MYKTKLQELCHQKLWALPKYTCMKDGPDHNPRFKASVSVNGVSFPSSNIFNSSKDAQNQAAKLAFFHFTASSSDSSMVSTRSVVKASKIQETCRSSENISNAIDVENDLQYKYKSQLENSVQWKIFDLPVYASKSKGAPHACSFKATVTVDGHTFESPEFFDSLKEAEDAAAKVALMSTLLDGFQEDDSGFYKNLLQEITQKEGFCLPSYRTIRSGAPHMSTFHSVVEVEREIFHGKAAKSKKQAEINAAKVAYTVFKERRLSRSGEFPQADEASESNSGLDSMISVDLQKNLNLGGPLVSSPTIKQKEHAEQSEAVEVVCAENLLGNAKVSSQDLVPSPSFPNIDNLIGIKNSSSCADKEGPPPPGTRSYLLCNRVRVYPCIPDNITFPEGITLLPISNDKWVAVSLEFPNEKGS